MSNGIRLRKLNSIPAGYRVAVNGVHIGDVYKTEHPSFPSQTLWYAYLPEQDSPLDPEFTRAESVRALVNIAERESV